MSLIQYDFLADFIFSLPFYQAFAKYNYIYSGATGHFDAIAHMIFAINRFTSVCWPFEHKTVEFYTKKLSKLFKFLEKIEKILIFGKIEKIRIFKKI